MGKINFEELSKRSKLFQEKQNNDKEEPPLKENKKTTMIPKTKKDKNLNLEKGGKKSEFDEIFELRNKTVKSTNNNLRNFSDITVKIIDDLAATFNKGKKEVADAIIISFYKENSDAIEKIKRQKIKSNKINV